jgi:ribonuclease HI
VYRLGFKKVELNIDSATVVGVIKKGKDNSLSVSSLLNQIWRMMDLDWQVEISHMYREANKCADALANIGCSTGYEIMYYETCPTQISELYLADCLGTTVPRLISV